VAALRVALELEVLPLGAPDHELHLRREAEVPAGREKRDLVALDAALRAMVEDVEEAAREGFVGEVAAAARRLRILLEAELHSQRHLLLPATAGDGVELLAVDAPVQLRLGGRKELGGEGPEQAALQAGVALDHPHGRAALALGPLAEH